MIGLLPISTRKMEFLSREFKMSDMMNYPALTLKLFLWVLVGALFLSACSAAQNDRGTNQPSQTRLPADDPTTQASKPVATENPASPQESLPLPTLLPDEPPPAGATNEFSTDFSKHSIPYTEILSGGPPKDGIPAIDDPKFVNVGDADSWLGDKEPVVFLQIGEDARAYPLQILTWHEIVNDTVGGVPVVVTFCPLCNTAITFERTVDGQVLDFGTTGRLRYSNLVMYDRPTESWWQQATGEAIAGEFTGQRLVFRPATIIAWEEFEANYPDGKVLSRETGYTRSYGSNPYVGYDNINNSPFLYRGPQTPGVLPAVARVLTVDLNGEAVAYPYDILQSLGVVNDAVGGEQVVIFWQPGTTSALDAGTIAGGRDVGAAAAFSRQIDLQVLNFVYQGGRILDDQTGSQWDVFGRAVGGELTGARLDPVVSVNHFWFSWAAFKPETRIYQP